MRPLIMLLAMGVLVSACARRQTPLQDLERPGQDVIVLLPDADGTLGRATVSNRAGRVVLNSARSATVIPSKQAPAAVTTLNGLQVRRLFGSARSALPPAPQHFTLFYHLDSEELTDGSRALVREVLRAVKKRRSADVVVLGHTDTIGTRSFNFELGLKRANSVRDLLVSTGLPASSITVVSHGEAELLIPTADGVIESQNRRVEITVR